MTEEEKRIVIISDGTGKTAKRLMDAVLAQYTRRDLDFALVNIYQKVRDRKTVDRILKDIEDDYLIVYSIIERDLHRYFHKQLTQRGILHINVLEPMLSTMSKFLGVHPEYQPGILHKIDDSYYRKVDAIGYTVEHDDGKGHLLREAEIILLGVSRTCKTPISMYLACNYGLKIANIPVVLDDMLTDVLLRRLKKLKSPRVLGLLMQPEVLVQIREERSQLLMDVTRHHDDLQSYCDRRYVANEFRYSRDLFAQQGWPVIDVTRRAIEEVSVEILESLGLDEGEPEV